jgi:hypothetical protein
MPKVRRNGAPLERVSARPKMLGEREEIRTEI